MLVSAKEMLDKALAGKYAVGQFNINNLEWTKSILLTAQEMNAPVILGVSEGAGKYMTDSYLFKEDPSLKTFRNFMKGEDYLNSSWTDQLHQNQRLHIIYLAVDPTMQHHGIAAELLEEAIGYAQKHELMISLETHNPKNVEFYEKFGFKVYGVMEKNFPLKQYCLIREVQ